jgi:hypothetical protein
MLGEFSCLLGDGKGFSAAKYRWENNPRWGCSNDFIIVGIAWVGMKCGWGVGDGGEGEFKERALGR